MVLNEVILVLTSGLITSQIPAPPLETVPCLHFPILILPA